MATEIDSWCRNIGAVLRILRIKSDMTQADLAARMNNGVPREQQVQQGSISKIENGCGFRMEFVLDICDSLGTSFANVIELAETLKTFRNEKQEASLAELKTLLHDRLMLPHNHTVWSSSLTGVAQNVYRKMKQLLSSGGHASGHLFWIREITTMFSCRASTAKKAVEQLILEGYVQRITQDVVAKSGFDAEYLASLFRNRLSMEFEAGLCIANMPGAPTKELEEVCKQMASRDCNIEQELALFVDDDLRFHQTILAISGKSELIPAVESMTRHVIIGLGTHAHDERRTDILKEHNEIISAIKSGDKERIFSAFRDHFVAGTAKWRTDVKNLLDMSIPRSVSELSNHHERQLITRSSRVNRQPRSA